MRERPILFSGPMVRALLAGTKTQTRRVVKPTSQNSWLISGGWDDSFVTDPENRLTDDCPYGQPGDQEWRREPIPKTGWYYVRGLLDPSVGGDDRPVWVDQEYFTFGFNEQDDPEAIELDSDITPENVQWKRPGDRLWVRETHRVGAWREDGRIAFDYAASPEITNTPWCQSPEEFDFESAWAGWSDYLSAHGIEHDEDGQYHWEPGKSPLPWRPSIFMHRWASRIALEVTAVRVERLQEISEEDAKAEGTELLHEYLPGKVGFNHRQAYGGLWESINGPGSWDANPWVWVVEFKVL